jgi:hypothetical protein
MTTLQDQIIDAMARALYDHVEPQAGRCGWCAFSAACEGVMHAAYLRRERIAAHDFTVRRPDEDDPTPSRYRDTAAVFYGMVQQANGPWEGIVAAAREAERTRRGDEDASRDGLRRRRGDLWRLQPPAAFARLPPLGRSVVGGRAAN